MSSSYRNSKGQFIKGVSVSPDTQFKPGQVSPRKGVKATPGQRKKMSESHIGLNSGNKHPMWKGGDLTGVCKNCKKEFTYKRKGAVKSYCNRFCYWKDMENRNKSSSNPNWRGGVKVTQADRGTKRYKEWRIAVFSRDNYTCQMCYVRGGNLEADHIMPFAYHKELRFELSNGRTLCKPCHRLTPTYGRMSSKHV